MSINALIFAFGAISSSAVGFAFLCKWLLDGRKRHDFAWAAAILSYAAGTISAGFQYGQGSVPAGVFSILFFWPFVAMMTVGNLHFAGRFVDMRLALCGAAIMAAASLLFGLHRNPDGLIFFTTIASLVYVWTGWIIRRLPKIGKLACAIFCARGLYLLISPALPDGIDRIPFSLGANALSFMGGVALLAGSLLRSRDQLRQSEAQLRETNARLVAHEAELSDSYALLQDQARRLETLTADYMRALDNAERANRAKDSFIANMNHELRTPLNAILGFTELIRLQAPLAGVPTLAEYAEYAHEGGQSMLRQVNRILDYIALDSGQRQVDNVPFDPAATAAAEIRRLKEAADAKQVVIAPQFENVPHAWAGGEQGFRTIIDELLRNAVRAAPQASTVTVRVAGEDKNLLLQIADSGGGLTDSFLETVGQGFNISQHVLQRGGDQQGVGLGLGIAARYAKLMGGALSLSRNEPKGTVAKVILQAA